MEKEHHNNNRQKSDKTIRLSREKIDNSNRINKINRNQTTF